jgi:hypothetical protein
MQGKGIPCADYSAFGANKSLKYEHFRLYYAVLLKLVLKGLPGDLEKLCSVSDVSIGLLHCLLHQ